jgi:hypothetical protein
MPILCELVENLRDEGFRFEPNVMLFGVQHLMDQTLGLCWALNELGLAFDRVALCGKVYSYSPEAAGDLEALGVCIQAPTSARLGSSHSKNIVGDIRMLAERFAVRKSQVANPFILVLDDGGQALTNLLNLLPPPFQAAGVEQTASGFWQTGIGTLPFPVVDVGSSAVKRLCEPPIVIDAVMKRAQQRLSERPGIETIGIVGLGYIGAALTDFLKQRYELSVFDNRPEALSPLPFRPALDCHEVIERSDVIFGCTGFDISRDIEAQLASRPLDARLREFMSLSSGDDEFFALRNLLIERSGNEHDCYQAGQIPDIAGRLGESNFRIARNGFPINFDNSRESAPLEVIQGTMAALTGALCQSQRILREGRYAGAGRYVLDLGFQQWLLRKWSRVLPKSSRPRGGKRGPAALRSLMEEVSIVRTGPESTPIPPVFGSWAAPS